MDSRCSSFTFRGFSSEIDSQTALQLDMAQIWQLALVNFFSLLKLFNYEHMNTQSRQCFLPWYAISVSQGQGCESALTVQFLHQQSAPHTMLPAMTRCASRVQSYMFPAKTQNSRRGGSFRSCCRFPKQPRPPEASETSPSDYSLIF